MQKIMKNRANGEELKLLEGDFYDHFFIQGFPIYTGCFFIAKQIQNFIK